MIGCKPQLAKLFFRDPLLASKCFFGPCTPPQYRLMGPGSWPGAKEAIYQAQNNIIYATKTRYTEESISSSSTRIGMIIAIIVAAIALTFVFSYST